MTKYLLLLLFLALTHCGPDTKDRENYGNITQTPGGITLIDPDEHVGGYGKKECLVCHQAALNIHRSPTSPVNADTLLEEIKKQGEAKYCLTCHGPNGL